MYINIFNIHVHVQDDIKVASSLNNVAGLLATVGRPHEALPLFTRARDIYASHLGEHHPRAVAAHLWIQQLSAPQPPARLRRGQRGGRRGTVDGERMPTPPPPLLEERPEDIGDDDGDDCSTVELTPAARVGVVDGGRVPVTLAGAAMLPPPAPGGSSEPVLLNAS